MSQLRLVFVMAGNDLRRRLRDRSAVITAFAAPFLLATIISVALGNAGAFEAEIGVVDVDRSRTTTRITSGLLDGEGDESGGLMFVEVESVEQALQRVDDEDLGAAIVFLDGFAEAASTRRPMAVEVIRDAERLITGDIATAVARGLVARLDVTNLSVAVTAATGSVAPDELGAVGARAARAAADLPVRLDVTDPGGNDVELASYFGPSMAMVFLFLTVGFGARSILEERRAGTLARLLAAPTELRSILAAKTVSVVALGLASILTLWVATSALFGASWGDPFPVLLLCLATVIAIAGISALVTSLARTEAQAEGYTSMVTFTLAILGGNFVTPDALPGALRQLSLLTPNGWALRAFTELAAGGGIGDIVPGLLVLLVVGLVTGAVALLFLSRLAPL